MLVWGCFLPDWLLWGGGISGRSCGKGRGGPKFQPESKFPPLGVSCLCWAFSVRPGLGLVLFGTMEGFGASKTRLDFCPIPEYFRIFGISVPFPTTPWGLETSPSKIPCLSHCWQLHKSHKSQPKHTGIGWNSPQKHQDGAGELRGRFASPQSCCSNPQPLSCPQGWIWEAFPGAEIHPCLQLPKDSMGSSFQNPIQAAPCLGSSLAFCFARKSPHTPIPNPIPNAIPNPIPSLPVHRACLFPLILGWKELILGTEGVETAFFAQVVAQ